MRDNGSYILGCDGRRIKMAWQEWEILLLRGAMEEAGNGTVNAIEDCAELLCRPIQSVRSRANFVREQDRKKAAFDQDRKRQIAREAKVPGVKPNTPFIRPPSMAQLMSGSTRLRTYNAWSGA